jgi:hypothetical protein
MSRATDPLQTTENIIGDRYLYGGGFDPRVRAVEAPKGSLFIQAGRNLSVIGLYQKQDDGNSTNWTPYGNDGGLNFKNAIYADSLNSKVGDGTSVNPFQSLQAAINSAAAMADDETTRLLILIGPDSRFDEDIIIPAGRHIQLIGLGPWILGDGALDNFASNTPRNITFRTDQADEASVSRPVLKIGTIHRQPANGTHVTYSNGVIISGDLIIGAGDESDPFTTIELHIENTRINGNILGNNHPGILNTYFYGCYINSIDDDSMRIQIANETRFTEIISARGYSLIDGCRLGNSTFQSELQDVRPYGIINSDFDTGATWTQAGILRLDGNSNYWFKTNSVILAGGATKTIIGDLVA